MLLVGKSIGTTSVEDDLVIDIKIEIYKQLFLKSQTLEICL